MRALVPLKPFASGCRSLDPATALIVCAALFAIAQAPVAGAQTLPLTEQEVLARLSPASPRVRAIRSGVDIVRADVLVAGRWPNPRVTVDREAVAGVTEIIAMVSQPLPVNGSRG